MSATGQYVVLTTNTSTFYVSSNYAANGSWTAVSGITGLNTTLDVAVSYYGDYVYMTNYSGNITLFTFNSTPATVSESPCQLALGNTPTYSTYQLIATGVSSYMWFDCDATGQYIAAGMGQGGVYSMNPSSTCYFAYSTNYGASFSLITGTNGTAALPYPTGGAVNDGYPKPIVTDGTNWIASNWQKGSNGGGGTYYNNNITGSTWTRSTTLTTYSFFSLKLSKTNNPVTGTSMALGLATVNAFISSIGTCNIYYSTDYGNVWTQIPTITINMTSPGYPSLAMSYDGMHGCAVNSNSQATNYFLYYGFTSSVLATYGFSTISFTIPQITYECGVSGNGTYIFVTTAAGIYLGTFNQSTFTLSTFTQCAGTSGFAWYEVRVSYTGQYIIALTKESKSRIAYSKDFGATWSAPSIFMDNCIMTPNASHFYGQAGTANTPFYNYT